MLQLRDISLAIIGLGYVGLPLAVEFGKKYQTVGFDIDPERVTELVQGRDSTREIGLSEFKAARNLQFTTNLEDIRNCNVYIVTVPTPISEHLQPELFPLIKASEAIAHVLKRGDVVIYESTVYPGATEEDCVPVLERVSGLKFNEDFFCGYSPERINPGDKLHRVSDIIKVTSGSTLETANFVDDLYASIITAGTHKASSIKVAEASKVIENTQRDLNIALVNEFAIIFNKLEIDTMEVLEAAGTKWNFLPFRPGLVGGHCIGVDPYYLTHKSQAVGYFPDVILAGRRINNNMGIYVAGQLIKKMILQRIHIEKSRILIMGLSFKENCPDIRNTKVVDIVHELEKYGAEVDVFDPWVKTKVSEKEYEIRLTTEPPVGVYDAIILAVPHDQFLKMGADAIRQFGKINHILYDLKCILPASLTDLRL